MNTIMKMKRTIFFSLFLVISVFSFAQTGLKTGLIKDEGGYTNIRKGPGTNYEVVEKWEDGYFINYKDTGGPWVKVYWYPCSACDLEYLGYMAKSKIVVPPKIIGVSFGLARVDPQNHDYTNIRKSPGGEVVGKVKDGSWILFNTNDYGGKTWVRVFYQNGKLRGYIHQSKLAIQENTGFWLE